MATCNEWYDRKLLLRCFFRDRFTFVLGKNVASRYRLRRAGANSIPTDSRLIFRGAIVIGGKRNKNCILSKASGHTGTQTHGAPSCLREGAGGGDGKSNGLFGRGLNFVWWTTVPQIRADGKTSKATRQRYTREEDGQRERESEREGRRPHESASTRIAENKSIQFPGDTSSNLRPGRLLFLLFFVVIALLLRRREREREREQKTAFLSSNHAMPNPTGKMNYNEPPISCQSFPPAKKLSTPLPTSTSARVTRSGNHGESFNYTCRFLGSDRVSSWFTLLFSHASDHGASFCFLSRFLG